MTDNISLNEDTLDEMFKQSGSKIVITEVITEKNEDIKENQDSEEKEKDYQNAKNKKNLLKKLNKKSSITFHFKAENENEQSNENVNNINTEVENNLNNLNNNDNNTNNNSAKKTKIFEVEKEQISVNTKNNNQDQETIVIQLNNDKNNKKKKKDKIEDESNKEKDSNEIKQIEEQDIKENKKKKADKTEKAEKNEKVEKVADKIEKPEKTDKNVKIDKTEKNNELKEDKKKKTHEESETKEKSKVKIVKEKDPKENKGNAKKSENDILSKLNLKDEVEIKIMDLMISHNRPYSLQNISDHLKGSIKKKQLETSLNNLVDKSLLISKQYNSVVYLVNQNLFPEDNPEEKKLIEQKLIDVENEIKVQRDLNSKLSNELKALKTQYTEEELDSLIKKLKISITNKKKELNDIKKAEVEQVPQEKMESMQKKYDDNKKRFKKLRKTIIDICDTFSEAMELSTKVFNENHGIEEDKDLIDSLKLGIK